MIVELLSDLVILLSALLLGFCLGLFRACFLLGSFACSCFALVLWGALHFVSCVATDIYMCLQDSMACLTSSIQASSAVETRAVMAETKPVVAAVAAATGATLMEQRDLAASNCENFRRYCPHCEPQIDCLSELRRHDKHWDISPISVHGSRTMAAADIY